MNVHIDYNYERSLIISQQYVQFMNRLKYSIVVIAAVVKCRLFFEQLAVPPKN